MRPILFFAALAAFIGVSMGAFGAHALKSYLTDHAMDIYKTAVSYQMWHALALGLIAVLPQQPLLKLASQLFMLGILLFSGSLYLLAITNISWIGMITPLGGLSLLAGWAILIFVSLQKNPELSDKAGHQTIPLTDFEKSSTTNHTEEL